ncbi:MAG: hypothetical protein OK404_02615 [Thaumarchaeota archaeon]|nr:hypothetical protein [Nitrososphaerota archaeon]
MSPILAALGFLVVLASSEAFVRLEYSVPASTETLAYLTLVGWVYLAVLALGLGLVIFAIRRVAGNRRRVLEETGQVPIGPTWLLPYLLSIKKYRRYFAAAAVLYGLFFSYLTGVIVYNPSIDIAAPFQAPHLLLSPCCDPTPLYSPTVVVYVTSHLGILLIPLTVILLVAVSGLVGLNFALAAFAFDNRAKTSSRAWLGGLGAIVGLFAGCPTCAGLAFAGLFGASGTLSYVLLLTAYQPVFIGLSIPLLVATPYLISRSLSKVYSGGCVILPGRASTTPA